MNSMELEEPLDVSWAVKLSMKGMEMPEVRSARAQELVELMLRAGTKEQIEELRGDLCAKIVKWTRKWLIRWRRRECFASFWRRRLSIIHREL